MTDLERAWHPASGQFRLAHSILQGMSELNALFPRRSQGPQEGTVGDTTHRAEGSGSDHNPNDVGVVRAWDIDVTGNDFNAQTLANYLALLMRNHFKMFGTKGYVIYNRGITPWSPWAAPWMPYTGSDPHNRHIHLSVGSLPVEYDFTGAWNLASAFRAPVPTPAKDWFTMATENELTALNHNIVVASARGSELYVSFPDSLHNPGAIYRVGDAHLLWITGPTFKAMNARYGGPPFVVPISKTDPIFSMPIVPGTPDPRLK